MKTPSPPVLREALVRLAITRIYSAATALSKARYVPPIAKGYDDKKPLDQQVKEARDLMSEALEAIDQAEGVKDDMKLMSPILIDTDGNPFYTGQRVKIRNIYYAIRRFEPEHNRIMVQTIGKNGEDPTFGLMATAQDLKGQWVESKPISL